MIRYGAQSAQPYAAGFYFTHAPFLPPFYLFQFIFQVVNLTPQGMVLVTRRSDVQEGWGQTLQVNYILGPFWVSLISTIETLLTPCFWLPIIDIEHAVKEEL